MTPTMALFHVSVPANLKKLQQINETQPLLMLFITPMRSLYSGRNSVAFEPTLPLFYTQAYLSTEHTETSRETTAIRPLTVRCFDIYF